MYLEAKLREYIIKLTLINTKKWLKIVKLYKNRVKNAYLWGVWRETRREKNWISSSFERWEWSMRDEMDRVCLDKAQTIVSVVSGVPRFDTHLNIHLFKKLARLWLIKIFFVSVGCPQRTILALW